MNVRPNPYYWKIGAAMLLCGVTALVFLLWPVSEDRWKWAGVVLENRYLYALACQGDTLYFTDASVEHGLQGESFRPEACERSRMGVGYFRWPWGGIVGQTDVMRRPYDEKWLEQHTAEIVDKTLERVSLHQQTMAHVLKELEYYESTHMSDDDGWVEMLQLHRLRRQEQARLDSLEGFLEKVQRTAASWHYISKVSAYMPGRSEALPCVGVRVGKTSLSTTLQGSMPKEARSVLNLRFGWDNMQVKALPQDTLQHYVGILVQPDGSVYKGMLKGLVSDGRGTLQHTDGSRYDGRFEAGVKSGEGEMAWCDGVHVMGVWSEGLLANGRLSYPDGNYYNGTFLGDTLPDGAGDWHYHDGALYEGSWEKGIREGFGLYVCGDSPAQAGVWQNDEFQGERLLYTENRVYGIDISRYQHLNRFRKPANIAWKYLRITSLGSRSQKRIKEEKVDYPISFAYVKCTEGVTVLNRFYKADDQQFRNLGIHVGAYHFFQGTPAEEQLEWFLKNVRYQKGDLPPVLDIEPTEAQIKAKWGSDEKMFSEMRIWLKGVEEALGVRPLLYVNQRFINRHLSKADAEFQTYDLWVARYGEFKPFTHMVCWQLSSDGRVSGIQSDVDINVFNGSREKFNEYMQSLQ